jgi:hypothetical protein
MTADAKKALRMKGRNSAADKSRNEKQRGETTLFPPHRLQHYNACQQFRPFR